MMLFRSILFLFTLATLFGCTVANNIEDTSHYTPCASGYRYKSKCYRLGRNSGGFSYGPLTCRLVDIDNAEENEFLTNMMLDLGEDLVWIDKGYAPKYSNFAGSPLGSCFTLGSNGKWTAHYYMKCPEMNIRPVCTIELTCEKGWIGKNCDRQCHCHDEKCSRYKRRCKYGCEPGWTGDGCFEETAAPKIEHYCLNYRSHFALALSIDLKSQKIGSLVPLGLDGQPINPEEYAQEYTKDTHLEISTSDLSSTFEPNFHERKIDGTTFEWDFRIRQYEHVRLETDVDIRVRCNFSDVDEMYGSMSMKFDKESRETHALTSTSTSYSTAGMFFSDPRNTEYLTNINIGQPIKVILLQQYINTTKMSGEDIKMKPVYLSPRKCVASSPDKKIIKQLTDADGCPLQHNVFARFVFEANYDLATTSFHAFGLPGYSSMNISCSMVACNGVNDSVCIQPCRHPVNSRAARSVAEIKGHVIQHVSASVNIR